MNVTIDSWSDVPIALAAVGLLLAIGYFVGARRARRRQTRSQMKSFKTERLGLDAYRRSLDDREIAVVRDERDLKRRKAKLDERESDQDDRDRDLIGREVGLDQREDALQMHERAMTGPVLA